MTRREIAAEVAQIARDWMLDACNVHDFEVKEIEQEPSLAEERDLEASLSSYFEKVRACLKT
jgi:hypothetical protein